MARIAYSSGGSTTTTTTSSLDVATGARTTGDVLLVNVVWRCSTPSTASITTSYANFQWITPTLNQGGICSRLGTVKWTANENMTFTLTDGGTVNAGYGNAVFFGSTAATTRWWTEYQITQGAITGASTQGTMTGSAITTSGTGADILFTATAVIADNAFTWDTAPTGWTNSSAQSSSVGEDWARQFSRADPTSGTTSPSYSGTFTTTSTIPASGSVDWILYMVGLSGSEVSVTPDTVTVTNASLTLNGQTVTVSDSGGVTSAVSYVGSATGTTSATIPAHQEGDLIVGYAFWDGSTAVPTVPDGWNEIKQASGTLVSATVAFKFAEGSSETSGTWTNATSLTVHVYRNAAGIGAVAVDNGASTTTVSYPALTLDNGGGTSWVAAFAGITSTDTSLQTAPTGFTNRSTAADATDEIAGHDTNGGVTSYAGGTVSAGGTAGNYCSASVEILDATANFNGGLLWKATRLDNTDAWASTGPTVTANATTAPDGTTTAERLTNGSAAYGHMMRQYLGFLTSTTYSASIYIKKDNHRYFGIRIDNSVTGANEQVPFYDFDTGTLNTNGITGATLTVTDAPNGFKRLALTYTGATNASGLVDFCITDSTGATATTAAGTEQVTVWGARLAIGTDPEIVSVTNASPALTGQTVNVIDAEFVTVTKADLTVSGSTVGILDAEAVTNAALALTGQTVTPLDAELVPVTNATLALTGQTVTPTDPALTDTITVTPATVTLTGQDVGIIDPTAPVATRAARGGGGPASPARIKAEEDYQKRKRKRERAIDASIEGFFDPKPEKPLAAPENGFLGPLAADAVPVQPAGPSFADILGIIDGPQPVPTWFPPFEPKFEADEDDEEILLLL